MALTNPIGGNINNPTGFNNTPNVATGIANNIASNITGILSTRPQAKYASGARCLLKVNGRLVGFAFGISWRIQTQVQEIRTVDNPLPYELVPQMITVDGTISALHIPGQGIGAQLWQPDVLNFLSQQYISIEARDTNDQLLFFTAEAMITSRMEEIKVDQLANVTLTFKAIGFRDERAPAVPDNLNSLSDSSSGQQVPGATGFLSNIRNDLSNQLPPGAANLLGSIDNIG